MSILLLAVPSPCASSREWKRSSAFHQKDFTRGLADVAITLMGTRYDTASSNEPNVDLVREPLLDEQGSYFNDKFSPASFAR